MKNRLLTVFSVVFAIFIVIAIFVTLWFWSDDYPDFNDFRQEIDIPGLKAGATPQGLGMYTGRYEVATEDGTTETITQDVYIMSAYFKNSPSKLFLTGSTTGNIGEVTVKDGETLLDGHFGGVATNGNKVWIADDTIIYVLNYSDLLTAAKENGTVEVSAKFHANCRASFLYFYDDTSSDKLYVGEFYKKGKYETDSTHHVLTNSGETNRAFAYEYTVSPSTSSSNIYGLSTLTDSGLEGDDKVPAINRILSLPNEVQGFARTQSGALVLSQSYGLKNSQLLYYKYIDSVSTSNYIEKNENRGLYSTLSGESYFRYHKVDGSEIRRNRTDTHPNGLAYIGTKQMHVYFVDSSKLLRSYSIPSMSEGLAVKGERIYVLFESAAKKYRLFVRQPINNVYSFIPRTK